MWPVNGTPASLMTLFCTGAVTMASNSPLDAAGGGAIEQRQHVACIGRIEPARHAGRRERHVDHFEGAGLLPGVFAARSIRNQRDIQP